MARAGGLRERGSCAQMCRPGVRRGAQRPGERPRAPPSPGGGDGPQQRCARARGRSAASCKAESTWALQPLHSARRERRQPPLIGKQRAQGCAQRRSAAAAPQASIRAGAVASWQAGAARGGRGSPEQYLPAVWSRGGRPRSTPARNGRDCVTNAPLLNACRSHAAPPAPRRRRAMEPPAGDVPAEHNGRLSIPSAAEPDASAPPGASRRTALRRTSQPADVARCCGVQSRQRGADGRAPASAGAGRARRSRAQRSRTWRPGARRNWRQTRRCCEGRR